MGEQQHLATGGYRANGFRVTIKALETINQLIIERVGAIKPSEAAINLWVNKDYLGASDSLKESVAILQTMQTPFAELVWKYLVTLLFIQLQLM